MTVAIIDARERQFVVLAQGYELIAPLVSVANTARDQALTARNQTYTARDEAQLAASGAAAAGNYYPTRAAGEAATTTGQLFATKDGSNNLVYYERTAGGSIQISPGAFATLTGAQTLENKTFAGRTEFRTDGNFVSVSGGTESRDASNSVFEVFNRAAAPTGLRVISLWEGSTAVPLVNNDTTLFVTYTKTLSDSANLTWTISAPNCHNWIPAGVRDGGERLAVYGWATSVRDGDYRHEGTLFRQVGGRFTAGFQGSGSAEGAVVEEAFCVDARLIRENAGTTIQKGYGVVVRSEQADGEGAAVLEYIGVHVRHAPGQNSNYALKAEAGLPVLVSDVIQSGTSIIAPSFRRPDGTLLDRDGNFNRIYRPGDLVGVYLGGTADARNVYANNNHVFQNSGAALTFANISDTGINTQAVFRVNGAQVVGPRGAAVPNATVAAAAPTKAEYDALVSTVNTLLARLRAHGLISA